MTDQIFTVLKITAWALYNAHPLGSDQGKKHWEWFEKVSPGDLVMETTTIWMDHNDPIRFGRLISAKKEPMFTDEYWEKVKDEYGEQGRPSEMVYRIRLLKDGTEMAWTNAHIVRLPKQMDIAAEFQYITRTGLRFDGSPAN